MKTQIFKNYAEFNSREDKSVNGVSEAFAADNPNYEKENESNEGCWNCSYCRGCSYCSYCRDCSDCSYCSYCRGCSYCSYCSYCRDCSDCSYCRDCSGCSGCSDCSGCSEKNGEQKPFFTTKIENIHSKVLEAIRRDGCMLKMDEWHADAQKNDSGEYCGATHCRAGWVVALAGKNGVDLEAFFGDTAIAALKIYNNSSNIKVPITAFFEMDKEKAMADIIRCAEEELKSKQ